MDDELAALGVTVADERAQEASVLGRRLASGAGLAPPLQIPSAAEGEWVGVGEVELFPKVALERLLELARGAAHAGNALRASVSAASEGAGPADELAVGVLRAALRYELGEEVPEAPAPPRRNKKEHRLAAAARAEAAASPWRRARRRSAARASRRAASGRARRRPAAPEVEPAERGAAPAARAAPKKKKRSASRRRARRRAARRRRDDGRRRRRRRPRRRPPARSAAARSPSPTRTRPTPRWARTSALRHAAARRGAAAAVAADDDDDDDDFDDASEAESLDDALARRPRPRRRPAAAAAATVVPDDDDGDGDDDFVVPDDDDGDGDDDFVVPDDDDEEEEEEEAFDDDDDDENVKNLKLSRVEAIRDDGDDGDLRARLADLRERGDLGESEDDDDADGSATLEGGLWIRATTQRRLFPHQRRAVSWLWALHGEGCGGIVGDEMGLGKTAQVGAFLAPRTGPGPDRFGVCRSALILAPTTMLSHWVRELHAWAPRARVVVLHRSSARFDEAVRAGPAALATFLARALAAPPRPGEAGGAPGPEFEETPSCVLCVASYDAVHRLADALLAVPWSYAVLDEGQKLRNPDSRVTQLCKRLRTPRRLLLSGTPVQNSLRELWSLFDFAVPGRLGTLKAFDQELAQPIRAGGFAGARPAQVQLAYRCAVALRDLIQPYLLRRTKAALTAAGDSGVALPPKTEHVLLCALSQDQIDLYRHVLDGDDVRKALAGDGGRQATAFRAIAALRKICNHPDLYGGPPEGEAPGAASRSSKLAALDAVLVRWKAQGHRVLVFSQTIAMLDVLEALVVARGWRYGRMDGGTAPAARQATADAFNASSKTFLMLLTTRTGGVGLSLVGADRVVLYDPDWNPQTDAQARERSWRLGQTKPVTIYRLVCAGTIEEKIYHRQIFKQALTNKVLSDAKQRRLFSQSELGELFTLGDAALAGATDGGDVARVEDFAQRTASADAPGADGDGDAVDGAALDDDDKQVLEALWDGSPDGALAKVFAAGDDEARQSAARAGLAAEAEREAGRAVAAVLDSRDEARGDAADLFGGTAPGSAALLGAIARRNDRARRDAPDPLAGDGRPASEAAVDLVRRLDAYLAAGAPTTDALLAHFADVTDPYLFRSILRQLAECRGGGWRTK
ncbi:hypothetical protein JL721_4820 [Aureococcus anophagefferens]|nr:hypothetical protein JL721_4820 [Aureococcus anophagefferens]